jgi:hypothetical protein
MSVCRWSDSSALMNPSHRAPVMIRTGRLTRRARRDDPL